jgi:DnaA-like protein
MGPYERGLRKAARQRRGRLGLGCSLAELLPAPPDAPLSEPQAPAACPRPLYAIIQEMVAKEFGLTRNIMLSKTRRAPIVRARQLAIWLCRETTNYSLVRLGEVFGYENASVVHAVKKSRERIQHDEELRVRAERLRRACSWKS